MRGRPASYLRYDQLSEMEDGRAICRGAHLPKRLADPRRSRRQGACLAVVERNGSEGVTWLSSYVSEDKDRTFCVYDAPSPEAIRKSAIRSKPPGRPDHPGSACSTPTSTSEEATMFVVIQESGCCSARHRSGLRRALPARARSIGHRPGTTHDAGGACGSNSSGACHRCRGSRPRRRASTGVEAGIGAAGGSTLMNLGTGGLLVSRRHRERGRPAATS